MDILCAAFLAFASSATVASQPLDYFFQPEASDYFVSEIGNIPPVPNADAHLALLNATLPYCSGTHDVIALTFGAPILHEIDASYFTVDVCPVRKEPAEDATSYRVGCASGIDLNPSVTPACAVLQPGDEPNERRTVLLMGSFTELVGQRISSGPQGLSTESVVIEANGRVLPSVSQDGHQFYDGGAHGWGWTVFPGDVLGYGHGPSLSDAAFHDLSAPLNTAEADPNGCAALYPSATYAVRLIFKSAVHERAADGSLAPFGTDAEAAAALFSLVIGEERETPSPDRLVGVADVDDDNVVDVCIEGAADEPQVEAVVINCTAGELLAPEGFPCDKPIMAEMKPLDGPVPEVVHDVSLCFELDPSDCPSAATTTLQSVLPPVLLLAAVAAVALGDVLAL